MVAYGTVSDLIVDKYPVIVYFRSFALIFSSLFAVYFFLVLFVLMFINISIILKLLIKYDI